MIAFLTSLAAVAYCVLTLSAFAGWAYYGYTHPPQTSFQAWVFWWAFWTLAFCIKGLDRISATPPSAPKADA